jgi:hypothetical protein
MVFEATRALLEGKNLGVFMDEKRTELFSVSRSATVADALKVCKGAAGAISPRNARRDSPGIPNSLPATPGARQRRAWPPARPAAAAAARSRLSPARAARRPSPARRMLNGSL